MTSIHSNGPSAEPPSPTPEPEVPPATAKRVPSPTVYTKEELMAGVAPWDDKTLNPQERQNLRREIFRDAGITKAEAIQILKLPQRQLEQTYTPLFGDTLASGTELKKEEPIHRRICYYLAMGMRNGEIAELLGVTSQTVVRVRNDPRNRELIAKITDDLGLELARKQLSALTTKAVQALADVLDSEIAKNADKIAAAKEVMARNFGPVTQVVHHTSADMSACSDKELMDIIQGRRN